MPNRRSLDGRVFQTPSLHDRRELTIKLPARFAAMLHRTPGASSPVYCIFMDGVLQISGASPDSAIPMLTTRGVDAFHPQPDHE